VAKRLTILVGSASLAVLVGGTVGAGGSTSAAGASASAVAIRVVVPGQAGSSAGVISSPPDHAAFGSGFAYPADGSVVSTGAISASASTTSGASATAAATSQVGSLSVFGGEVTATAIEGAARGSTRGRSARGDFAGASISGLTVLGAAAAAAPNGRVALGDWGYAVTLEQGTDRSSGAGGYQGYHGFVTALAIHLTAPHGNLPAGSEIQVGYAEASVRASAPPAPKPVVPGPAPQQKKPKKSQVSKTPTAPEPTKGSRRGSAPLLQPPVGLQPQLTAGGYVFPVYGPASYGDTYGAFRGDVAGNWHHGDDIFAPLGAPILACADGIVFSVGWNDVGGNRLWLRDDQGNEFYYAHLSAFTPVAQNARRVKAGDVLGFVGNTGDAQGTPTHLHFEVHPYSLLFMGYDGAVNPTPYLDAWKHLQDVRFSNVAGWLARTGISDPAPKPAAILLQVSDISEASGLDPGSLKRAMARRSGGEGQVARALGVRPKVARP
jgi:murein DD-endopeptidase MepM/ murein hydrolase activator NlpD